MARSVAIDVDALGFLAGRRLRDRERRLGHRVAGGERLAPEAEGGEARVELVVALGPDGLAAVDHHAEAVEPDAFEIVVVNAVRHQVVGEVGKPGQRRALLGDRLQQENRRGHPLEGVDLHDRGSERQRQLERRDEPHVVVQREPAHHAVVGGVMPIASP